MNDLIDRQAAIEAIEDLDWYHQNKNKDMVLGANSDEHQAWYKADDIYKALESLPSAHPEPFTDEEQRRFLSAMGREERVCKHVDAVYEAPYEDSLVRICHEITRKVKGALWT